MGQSSNTPGLIDSGYCGELIVLLNTDRAPAFLVERADCIAQFRDRKVEHVTFKTSSTTWMRPIAARAAGATPASVAAGLCEADDAPWVGHRHVDEAGATVWKRLEVTLVSAPNGEWLASSSTRWASGRAGGRLPLISAPLLAADGPRRLTATAGAASSSRISLVDGARRRSSTSVVEAEAAGARPATDPGGSGRI